MLKLIRLVLAVIGLLVVAMLSIDNRAIVPLSFWPLPYASQAPLYWVFLAGLVIGVVLGGLASWLSRAAARSEARQLRRKVSVMEQQEKAKRDAEEQAQVEEARRKTQALALTPSQPVAALAAPR